MLFRSGTLLRYKQDGLYLRVMYDGDGDNQTIGEIHLSSNPRDYLPLMGLSFTNINTFYFQNPTDMFDYLFYCVFFCLHDFDRETGGSGSALKRKRHRPIFEQFVEYVCVTKEEQARSRMKESVDLDATLEYFGKTEEYIQKITQHKRQRMFRNKFNGKAVGRITGLEGKELGRFMTHIRESSSSLPNFSSFVDYVIGTKEEDVYEYIQKQYVAWI